MGDEREIKRTAVKVTAVDVFFTGNCDAWSCLWWCIYMMYQIISTVQKINWAYQVDSWKYLIAACCIWHWLVISKMLNSDQDYPVKEKKALLPILIRVTNMPIIQPEIQSKRPIRDWKYIVYCLQSQKPECCHYCSEYHYHLVSLLSFS